MGSPALRTSAGIVDGETVNLSVVPLGTVSVPSGVLGVGDPGHIDAGLLLRVPVAPGAYPVLVTRFDRTRRDGDPWTVSAALSVVLSELPEQRRGPLPTDTPRLDPEAMDTVGVDGGVVGFLDWAAYDLLCTEEEELMESFFFDEMAARPMPWDQPLPGRSENLVADQSGYGDGRYPVYAGFAADGRVVAVHVDFNNAALTSDRFAG